MKDYIDKIIIENITEKSKTPKALSSRIIQTINKDCFKEEKVNQNKNNVLYKFATGLCACLLITTSVVFAKEIVSSIFHLSKANYGDKKLNSAIEDGYFQTNDTNDYLYSENGIAYKFSHVLLNDINLIISLDFILDEEVEEYQGLSITGLKLFDENNNQIFIDSEDQNIHFKNLANSMNFFTVEKNGKNIKESIVFTSPEFNNIKKLNLSFNSIILYNVINGTANIKTIEGNYNLEINLNDSFNNRKIINYGVTNNSNEIEVLNVKLTNTGLGILLSTSSFGEIDYKIKILDDNNNEIYSKLNEFSNYHTPKTYFAWLDVDENLDKYSKFKLEITDNNKNTYIFEVNKK